MPGLSVKLPLVQDQTDGLYRQNKTFVELVKQDLKMLVLTEPGERILIPDYGVGIYNWLFENVGNVEQMQANLVSRLNEQVDTYLPYITIDHVDFQYDEFNNPHLVNMRIEYTIIPLEVQDFLDLNDQMGN